MTTPATNRAPRRVPLSRERVLDAAIKLADQGGLESLSMRKLGQELGVEAMALYYHFANKDEVIDGIVDIVFSEIELPTDGAGWKTAMRQRAISMRDVLLAPSLGDRPDGVAEERRSGEPAPPRRGDRQVCERQASRCDRWSPTRTRSWTATSMASP